jgi:hypothetical protein
LYLKLFAIFLAITASITSGCCNVDISNSISTNAGSVSYSISYGNGLLTQKSTEKIVSNNDVLSVAVGGCSVQNADWIYGRLDTLAAGGDYAYVIADIKGPEASVTNYNLYGYVTHNFAWAGQYADSIKGCDLDLYAHSQNTLSIDYSVAESKLITNAIDIPLYLPDYSVYNWYQDSMAGGSYNPAAYPQGKWAMSDIYYGTPIQSSDPNSRIDITTANAYYVPGSPDPRWTWSSLSSIPYGSGHYLGTSPKIRNSMGYADAKISYSNVEITSDLGDQGVFDYYYINLNKGINTKDTIYW